MRVGNGGFCLLGFAFLFEECVNSKREKALEKLYGPATLYNVGIYTWILLVMFIYALSRRMWKVVLCYSLLLGILVSLLLGTPVFAEFRYYYSIIANLPFIIMLPFLGKRTSVEKVVGGGSVVQAGTQ